VLDRIKLVAAEDNELTKGLDGLIRHKDGIELEANAAMRVVTGSLETSNVNIVESMVNMISLARQYESQVKMMKAAEDMDRKTDQMLQLS
jgi:flagellar basal-body rod protein FlgF